MVFSFPALLSRVATVKAKRTKKRSTTSKDAIRLHVEDRLADGEEIPQVSVSLSTVEIAV